MKKSLMAMTGGLILSLSMAQAANAQTYCREYTQQFNVGRHIENGYGTACLQPDGSWQTVSNSAPAAYATPVNYVPAYAPAVTYVERPVYVSRPAPIIRIGFGGYYNDRHWRDNRRWHGHRDYHRGRGHGRGHGHGHHR